jgi:hypothetical protein
MANTDKAYGLGQKDANLGKGPANTRNQPWQVQQSYKTGYDTAKKGK